MEAPGSENSLAWSIRSIAGGLNVLVLTTLKLQAALLAIRIFLGYLSVLGIIPWQKITKSQFQ